MNLKHAKNTRGHADLLRGPGRTLRKSRYNSDVQFGAQFPGTARIVE